MAVALSPITSVPIMWQNTLTDVQPTSQYGRDFDRAMISTNLLLQVPADQDVTFILPSADAPESAPLLRLVNEAEQPVHEFNEVTPEEAQQEVESAITGDAGRDQQLWEAVKGEARQWRQSRARLRAGDQLVRFTSRQRIEPVGDGSYELRVLAPLASFVLQPGGSISFAVGLPRIPGRTVAIDHAVAENPPGNLLADISERPTIANRVFVAHFWQNDPLYRVKYRYQ
jgi:hypothetical protein